MTAPSPFLGGVELTEVKVLRPFKDARSGEVFRPGGTRTLRPDQAKVLEKAGFVKIVNQPELAPPKPKPKKKKKE